MHRKVVENVIGPNPLWDHSNKNIIRIVLAFDRPTL